MKRLLFIAIALVLTLASCNKKEEKRNTKNASLLFSSDPQYFLGSPLRGDLYGFDGQVNYSQVQVFGVNAINDTSPEQWYFDNSSTATDNGTTVIQPTTMTGAGRWLRFYKVPTAGTTTTATAYGSGTAYTLTTTSAKVTFGTTSPSITLPVAGTYLITSNVSVEYSGLTTLATAACNFKLRRTNNTAADLANTSTNFTVPIVTLLSQTAGDVDIPSIIYTTTNSNDVIELWGNRGNNVSLGQINAGQANIVAVKLN